MEVDAVIYSVIVDPVRATYEVQNLRWGLEQLTLSALRNVIGQLDLDHTLASRDTTNSQLRAALDTATQQWGVKVMRIELKNITPPEEIRLTMEKQMTAERTRRAVVTTAEGEKSSAILRAEGQKQSQIVTAEGSKQAAILAAEGQAEARLRVAQAEAQAIQMVAQAIGAAGNPGAVPDRAALSGIADRDRDRRQQAGVHAVRSDRHHGVARRHQGTAERTNARGEVRMMTRRSTQLALLLLFTFTLVESRAAFAQTDRPLQLGAGYQFLHQSVERGGQNFPVGAYIAAEQAFTSDPVKAWAWMGQFEAGLRSDSGVSQQIYTFLGGIPAGQHETGSLDPVRLRPHRSRHRKRVVHRLLCRHEQRRGRARRFRDDHASEEVDAARRGVQGDEIED